MTQRAMTEVSIRQAALEAVEEYERRKEIEARVEGIEAARKIAKRLEFLSGFGLKVDPVNRDTARLTFDDGLVLDAWFEPFGGLSVSYTEVCLECGEPFTEDFGVSDDAEEFLVRLGRAVRLARKRAASHCPLSPETPAETLARALVAVLEAAGYRLERGGE